MCWELWGVIISNTYKRGTVGDKIIQKLVKRYGNYPMGLYILARACEEANENALTISEYNTPKYKKLMEEEAKILAKYSTQGPIPPQV